MEENLKKNIAKLLEKSEQRLRVAKSLLSEGYYEDAVSRAYYSMFLSCQALL